MPWFLRTEGNKTCVVAGTKNDPGETVKCHVDSKKAAAHLRALYKNVEHQALVDSFDALPDEFVSALAPTEIQSLFFTHDNTANLTNWTVNTFAPTSTEIVGSHIRLYFAEGEKTPDGRVIDPNAINLDRPPPWPITLQTIRADGHDGAVIAGVLDRGYRDGTAFVFEGRLDLNGSGGKEAERLIREGIMATWSPDLGDATIDIEQNVLDEDGETPQEQLAHFVKATFLGATLVSMPALASAVVELLDQSGNVLVSAPKRDVLMTEPVAVSTDPTDNKQIIERTDGPTELSDKPQGGVLPGDELYIVGERGSEKTIAACAGPAAPPAAFFAKQDLTELQRWVTITPDGHVYGHAAGPDECHIGFLDRCITIADIADCAGIEGCNYEYAMPGHTITAEGISIGTGPLPVTGGHADKNLGYQAAMSHYDDPRTSVANVCYYNDEHGVQFTGAIVPHATEEQINMLRASGVSLDARLINDQLRYLATCSVNTPGFPKVSMRLAASANPDEDATILSVTAIGGTPLPADGDCGCGPDPFDVVLARISDEPFDAVLAAIDPQPFDEVESRLTPDSAFDAVESRLST